MAKESTDSPELAEFLKKARGDRSQVVIAQLWGRSLSLLVKAENRGSISPPDLAALLDVLKITDPKLRTQLLSQAKVKPRKRSKPRSRR